jgi:hypothetical protein
MGRRLLSRQEWWVEGDRDPPHHGDVEGHEGLHDAPLSRPGHTDNAKNHCFYTLQVCVYCMFVYVCACVCARIKICFYNPPCTVRAEASLRRFTPVVINDSKTRSYSFPVVVVFVVSNVHILCDVEDSIFSSSSLLLLLL